MVGDSGCVRSSRVIAGVVVMAGDCGCSRVIVGDGG